MADPIAFDSISFEYRTLGTTTWTDFTTDVLREPHPTGGRGQVGNGWLDRVGDGRELTFSVDNSANNSQGSAGYYSTLFLVGNEIRVGFTWNNRTMYKWQGYISPIGSKATSGIYLDRRVDVVARDWMGLIAEFPLDFLEYTTDKTIDEAVALIASSLPYNIQPIYTDYNTGDYTFPDVFDLMKGETTAIGEFNKLAVSEMGQIFTRSNEIDGRTLVVENKLYRNSYSTDTSVAKQPSDTTDLFLLANGTDHLLLANGSDKLLLVETTTLSFSDADVWNGRTFDSGYGRHFANYIKSSTTPRVLDAAATTVLWTMEAVIEVPAGDTVSGIRGRYRDPNSGANYVNGINMVTPVASTDFFGYQNNDATGTDFTAYMDVTVEFGTAEVEISIRNTGGTALYTGGTFGGTALFQVRGQGVYVYDTTDVIVEPSSYPEQGRSTLTFDMPYQGDPVEARRVLLLSVMKDAASPFVDVTAYPLFANRDTKNMQAWMYLDIGKRATFADTLTTYNNASFIVGYDFEIIDMQYVGWSANLVRYDKVPTS